MRKLEFMLSIGVVLFIIATMAWCLFMVSGVRQMPVYADQQPSVDTVIYFEAMMPEKPVNQNTYISADGKVSFEAWIYPIFEHSRLETAD